MANVTPSSPNPSDGPGAVDLVLFVFDLTAHETRRLAAVLDAMPDWDPAAVLAGEAEAHAMLYSGLDAHQLAVYDMLRAQGVLDARP